MRIDRNNCQLINTNKVDIHDAVIKDIHFDTNNKMIAIRFCISSENIVDILFYDIISIQSKLCDFWGKSPNVLDFQYIKDSLILNNLQLEYVTNKYPFAQVKDFHNYFEAAITFASGNVCSIVCRYIEIKNQGNAKKTGDG